MLTFGYHKWTAIDDSCAECVYCGAYDDGTLNYNPVCKGA